MLNWNLQVGVTFPTYDYLANSIQYYGSMYHKEVSLTAIVPDAVVS